MPVWISMLRGVNVGPYNRIKMDALRGLYESLRLEDPRTYLQSGNVIFRCKKQTPAALTGKIEKAFEGVFGFRSDVVLRSAENFRATITANPFRGRRDVEPAKLLVTFLVGEPGPEAKVLLRNLKPHDEELHLIGRELYIYFPNGSGQSKLPWASLAKLLKTSGTARNLNSVVKMLEIAQQMESEH